MAFRIKVKERTDMRVGEWQTAEEAIEKAKELSIQLGGKEIVVYEQYARVLSPVIQPIVFYSERSI